MTRVVGKNRLTSEVGKYKGTSLVGKNRWTIEVCKYRMTSVKGKNRVTRVVFLKNVFYMYREKG